MSFLRHGFPHLFTTFLSCRCRHSRSVNCANALPLYCVRCYALPDPCASIATTATSPRRLWTALCNSHSYNSRTHCTSRLPMVSCECVACTAHVIVVRRVRRSYCKFCQYFSFFLHVVISMFSQHLHTLSFTYPSIHMTVYGVSWPSGLAYRTQVLVLAAECGFESRPWHLCPWARHLTIIASLHPGVKWVPVRAELVD